MLDRITIGQWHDFAAPDLRSTAFHHRHWLELILEQYGGRCLIFALKSGGEIVAALPFIEAHVLWGARRKLVALPFTDCLRPLAKNGEARESFAQALPDEDFDDYDSALLRTDAPFRPESCRPENVRHELDLGGPLSQVEARYPASLKRNLRRAERSGLRFVVNRDLDGIRSFYDLHVRTRRKKGVPVQPKSYFRRLHEKLIQTGLGFVACVEKGGRPIAGAVLLKYNGTMIYKYGASDSRELSCRPNEFLFMHLIRTCYDRGCRRLDFGTSRFQDEGLRRFKSKWGAAESNVYYETLSGRQAASHGDSFALKIASVAIRKGPRLVCRGLGEMFYRYSQ